MKLIKIFIISLLFVSPALAVIQDVNLHFLGDIPYATSGIAMFALNEMYVPPTHYSKGDITITASPIYFEVETLLSAAFSKISADDYSGYGFSVSSTYAITDTIITYVNYSSIYSKGTLRGDHTVDAVNLTWGNPYKASGESAFDMLLFGIGYDFIDGENWSLPFFLGYHYIKGVTRIEVEPLPGNTLDPSMVAWSSGSFSSMDFSIALSRKIAGSFLISAYLIYIYSESDRLPLIATVVAPNPSNPIHARGQSDTMGKGVGIDFFVPGLSVRYKLKSFPVNVFISIAGVTSYFSNWYNDMFFEGLEMKSFMLGVTYSDNISSIFSK